MATTSYGTPYVEAADLVSGYPGTSLTLADRVDDISFKGNGINNQTGTTYTLDILDAGKTVTLSNSSAVTVTIPTNTAEAIEVGSIIRFNNKGAGLVTIQPDGGVTLNGGNISLAQNAAAQIVKLDTNTWGAIDSLGSVPGLSLVSPSSIANSGGSASASGGAITFSAVNSVSMNGVFSATYDSYKVMINVTAQSNTGTNISIRMRAAGSDNSSSNYYYNGPEAATSAVTTIGAARSNGTQTRFISGSYYANPGGYEITFIGPFLSQKTMYLSHSVAVGDTDITPRFMSGMMTVTTSYDGFTLYPDSGTITGTLRIYGFRN